MLRVVRRCGALRCDAMLGRIPVTLARANLVSLVPKLPVRVLDAEEKRGTVQQEGGRDEDHEGTA